MEARHYIPHVYAILCNMEMRLGMLKSRMSSSYRVMMQGWSDRWAMLGPKIGFMLTKLGQD